MYELRFPHRKVTGHILTRFSIIIKFILDATQYGEFGIIICSNKNEYIFKFIDCDGNVPGVALYRMVKALIYASDDTIDKIYMKLAQNNNTINCTIHMIHDCKPRSNVLCTFLANQMEAYDLNLTISDKPNRSMAELCFSLSYPKLNYIEYFTDTFYESIVQTNINRNIVIDCGNMVSDLNLIYLTTYICRKMYICLINTSNIDIMGNYDPIAIIKCGPKYISKYECIPSCCPVLDSSDLLISLDSSLNRLLFTFSIYGSEKLYIIESDKILIMIMRYIIERIDVLELDPDIAIVSSIYANSAISGYINNNFDIHHIKSNDQFNEASKYDIGGYVRPKGTGTILFKHDFVSNLFTILANTTDPDKVRALNQLINLTNIFNQSVEDAITFIMGACIVILDDQIELLEIYDIYKYVPVYKTKINTQAGFKVHPTIFEMIRSIEFTFGCDVKLKQKSRALTVYIEHANQNEIKYIRDLVLDVFNYK